MEKTVIAGASREKQKYFFEPKFNVLPDTIKDEIRNICIISKNDSISRSHVVP